jgi:DNA-binding NarL/FixJ family response regulator
MIQETPGSRGREAAPQIVIVGANRMQNELVAYFLTRKVGRRCYALPSLGEMGETAGAVRVILHDCTGIGSEGISALCRRCELELSANELLALFNLGHDTGLEEEVIARGVRGIFYRHDSVDHLNHGVQAILNGESWAQGQLVGAYRAPCPERAPEKGIVAPTPYPLTAREEEILTMISAGLTNEAIAEQLFISSHTVKTHLYNIFRKIKVPNRLQAALWAARHLTRERRSP